MTALELKDLAPLRLRLERARGDVEPALVTPLLRGSAHVSEARKRMERIVAAHPVLAQRTFVFQNHSERYNSAVAKMYHYVQLLRTHDITDATEQQLLYNAIGERLPIDVHRAMFIPTLENQASEAQQRTWLQLAKSYRILGAYAQTELGHGSNVQGIETTAHYDKTTQEFIINSPTLTSRKWWPGGLGKTATHAIVHARLSLNGKDAGIQAFIVPLRSLEDHTPLPGVEVGDIGPKVGFQSVDNGYATFHNVRVPREHMLMKFAHVAPDGAFTKPPSDKLVYLTMVHVRAFLIRKLGAFLAAAATITTRFSAARVQGNDTRLTSRSSRLSDDAEVPVLDYQNQQLGLLPRIALSYAATFAGDAVSRMHDRALASLQSQSSSFPVELAEVHAVASGVKAWLADEVGVGIEALRRLCGGHGFSQSSNLPHLYAEIVGASTYEGTFDVLVQQHARFLIKQAASSATPDAGDRELRQTCRATRPEDFSDLMLLLEAFRVRAARATQALVTAVQQSPGDMTEPNPHMVLMTKASVAHSELMLLQAFADRVASGHVIARETHQALAALCALFGTWLLVRSLGDFRNDDYVSSAQGAFAHTHLVRLLAAVRPNAVLLTDAWDFTDWELDSAIGRYDGDMYRALVKRVRDEPLNETQVAASYEPFLKPLIQSRL